MFRMSFREACMVDLPVNDETIEIMVTFTFRNSVSAASLFTDHRQRIKLPRRK
jgi:hypothetical protein